MRHQLGGGYILKIPIQLQPRIPDQPLRLTDVHNRDSCHNHEHNYEHYTLTPVQGGEGGCRTLATILISSLIPLQSRPHHKLYTDRVPWAYQYFTSQLRSSPPMYNYTQRIAKLYINIIDPGHRRATRNRPQPSFATIHDVTRPLVSHDSDTRVASTYCSSQTPLALATNRRLAHEATVTF